MTILKPGGAVRETELNRARGALEEALLEETGLIVEVELVESDADGVAALCNIDGSPDVAWLSGLGYAAASAQGCAVPALMVERGTGRQASTSEEVVLIVNSELEASGATGLAGETFCRVGFDDVHTWLVPMLMLRAGGLTEVPEAIDVEDVAALIQAVAEGEDCTAAGLTAADFERFGDDAADSVRVLNRTAEIPYAILMYPPQMPLDTRTRLVDGLLDMAESDALETLLDLDGLVRVEDDSLEDFESFLSSTGIDFAQLGSE
jgi:ABC-type phosphate/phosphonate transport system substrate-binding protein